MTNILKTHREQFAKQFSAEIFDPKIEKVTKGLTESNLGMQLYRIFVSEEQEKVLRELPDCIVGHSNVIRFAVDRYGWGWSDSEKVIIGPEKTYPLCRSIDTTSNNSNKGFSVSSEVDYLSMHKDKNVLVKGLTVTDIRKMQKIAKEARAHFKAIKQVCADKESFQEEILSQLGNVRTLKTLKKVWPECYDDFVRIAGLSEGSGRSIALPVANLNNIIESHRREQERDSAKAA